MHGREREIEKEKEWGGTESKRGLVSERWQTSGQIEKQFILIRVISSFIQNYFKGEIYYIVILNLNLTEGNLTSQKIYIFNKNLYYSNN